MTREAIWGMKAAEEICSNTSTKAVRVIAGSVDLEAKIDDLLRSIDHEAKQDDSLLHLSL